MYKEMSREKQADIRTNRCPRPHCHSNLITFSTRRTKLGKVVDHYCLGCRTTFEVPNYLIEQWKEANREVAQTRLEERRKDVEASRDRQARLGK